MNQDLVELLEVLTQLTAVVNALVAKSLQSQVVQIGGGGGYGSPAPDSTK